MNLEYQSEALKLEELSQKEANNDQILFSSQSEALLNQGKEDLLKISFNQISILKEKNKLYQGIVNRFEIMLQSYNNQNNTPRIKYINIDGIEDIQETPIVYKEKKLSMENEAVNNGTNDLEDYIDKLNNNIEMLKKAFNENLLPDLPENNLDETTLSENPENLINQSEIPRKKEKSLFFMPAGSENFEEVRRKFQSFNHMHRMTFESALENSSYSLSALNQKLRMYPERIKSLEEELIIINEKLVKVSQENQIMNNKNEDLQNEIQKKIKEISVLKEEVQIQINKINAQNSMLEEMKKSKEAKEESHYKISHSLDERESLKPKPVQLELSQKQGCCKIF